MPRLTPALALCALVTPMAGLAQGFDMPPADPPASTEAPDALAPDALAPDALERSVTTFMENLMRDMAPHLENLGRDMEGAANALAPTLRDIGTLIDDIRNYEMPQRLENGDILIRRRSDAPPPPPVSDRLNRMVTPQDTRPAPSAPAPDPEGRGRLRDLLRQLPENGINL